MGIIKNLLFGKYLIITNTVSCGVMMGVGDAIQQKSDSLKRKFFTGSDASENEELPMSCPYNYAEVERDGGIILASTSERENSEDSLDSIRIRNMFAVGTAQGPFHHYFYAILDKVLPGRNAGSIVKKTVLDQAIASPTCLAIFFFGHGALEQRENEDVFEEIREKFFTTYKVDCCFWPPTQMINFLLVPVQYRVIYVNVMNIVYDIFLSYAKYECE
ncbi:mpv17-like protein 2 [Fopius arisanus]|uniref:Mpv17-like protein 2 n=1 Tax=Fopius arisanus TaxID=64838 RepID=A0A0C9R2I5_9HYME|nr:PREDICTED: mpv17-like protein 2 [Fopius arisanus]